MRQEKVQPPPTPNCSAKDISLYFTARTSSLSSHYNHLTDLQQRYIDVHVGREKIPVRDSDVSERNWWMNLWFHQCSCSLNLKVQCHVHFLGRFGVFRLKKTTIVQYQTSFSIKIRTINSVHLQKHACGVVIIFHLYKTPFRQICWR